jgi:very-short-patch-repair endonuclease
MSRPHAPLPGDLPPVFTARRARAAGLGRSRLRAPDIRPLARGLYARAGTGASVAQIVRALMFDDPSVVAWGPTAAELLAIPIPRALEAAQSLRIHVLSSHKHVDTTLVRWHRRADVEMHADAGAGAGGHGDERAGPGERAHADGRPVASDTILVGGVRTTGRISTWCDLGPLLGERDLVAVADHLVRRPRPRLEGRTEPYATLDQLAAALEARDGRRGVRTLRAALGRTRVGSDSPAETALRLALEDAGLPAPRLNERMNDGGVDLGEPDLSWPRWRVCLEHEGPRHLTRAQQEKDIERTERRVGAGWIEVRTVASDLRHRCSRAVIRVAAALRSQGWAG